MKIEWSEKTPRKIQQFPNPDYPSDNPELEMTCRLAQTWTTLHKFFRRH